MIMVQYFIPAIAGCFLVLLSFSLVRNIININAQQKEIKEQEEEYEKIRKELIKKTKKEKFLLPKWD